MDSPGTYLHTPACTLTVIIATHNHADELARTLRSLQAQSFVDYETIIVDDASTDGTWEHIQRLDWPQLVRAHRLREPQGEAASYNLGLEWARSRYVVFHGAGDLSTPDRFEIQIAQLERHQDLAALTCSTDWVDGNGMVLHHFEVPARMDGITSRLREKDVLTLGAGMFRCESLAALGGFRSAFRYGAGYDLWLRFVEEYELENQAEALYQVPFDPTMPEIARRSLNRDYTALARQLAAERLNLGREQSDLTEMAASIETRHARLDPFARRARRASSYLDWAEQLRQWGQPASDHARRLWWRALLAWPFSKALWRRTS
jgi:glycosyltransferase involved in cell wall biosynthesis